MSNKHSFLSLLSGLALASSALIAASSMAGAVAPPRVISGPSPFAGCFILNETGTNYLNAEVEPWVAVNPRNPFNTIAGWQQDRWSDGGARGLVSAYSKNGGRTWTRVVVPGISKCSGGTGEFSYDRATDPWVDFSPNGVAYFFSLSFSAGIVGEGDNAMLVSRSTDGGASWGPPQVLLRDADGPAFNDKNALTADPFDSNFVYATWDRLLDLPQPAAGAPAAKPAKVKRVMGGDGVANARDRRKQAASRKSALAAAAAPTFEGPTYFARTTNGGQSWEPAKEIYNPGGDAQTIGNLVVVLNDGAVMNFYTEILADGSTSIGYVKSTDKGATFGPPTKAVDTNVTLTGSLTPDAEEVVRDGNILFDTAIDRRNGNLYLVWQDGRDRGIDRVAFSMSRDDGATWSEPVIINKTPESANLLKNQAFLPSIEVGRRGEVYVTYYDFRNDGAVGELTDYWVITCERHRRGSCANPRSWRHERRLTRRSFDMLNAPVARGHFLGDYMGLARQGPGMRAVFGIAVGPNENEMVTTFIP